MESKRRGRQREQNSGLKESGKTRGVKAGDARRMRGTPEIICALGVLRDKNGGQALLAMAQGTQKGRGELCGWPHPPSSGQQQVCSALSS